jgi:hypothetical protein
MNQYKCLIIAILMVVSSMTISICSCEADVTDAQSLQIKKEINSSIIISGPQEEWNKTYGGTKWDECSAVELTAEGGYIFAGTINANGYDNGGDCWLLKTDSNGDVIWQKTYGGLGSDTGTDLCTTHDGGYALIGYTRSFGAGGCDVYLIKTDSNGDEQWNRTFGGSQDDYGLAIQQCADEGFIIAGATQSYGAREAWLIKTNAAGGMEWQQRFCGNRPPGGYFMTVLRTVEDDYVAAGRNYLGDMSDSDILVVKIDRNGTIIWEKLLGDPNCKDSALGIAATSDGCYMITGQVEHQETEHDILLMKINENGEEVWIRTFNETIFFDTGLSVKETNDRGFLIAGEVGTNLNNPVLFNAILIKTDSTGMKEWSMIYGKAGSESFYEALQTPNEGYIAGGFTTSYGAGSQDALLIKFTSFENQPPDTPLRPSGSSSGNINQEYYYTTQANDPDTDEIYYFWDWGDGANSGWLGPYDSGEECNTSHTWSKKGNYEIKVKARDNHGGESDWSNPLPIKMPYSYNKTMLQFLELLFQRVPNAFQILRQLLG